MIQSNRKSVSRTQKEYSGEPVNNNYKPIFPSFIDLLPKRKKLQRGRLQPIKEGNENLPKAIKFPPIQLLGEASGEEKPYDLGEIAYSYLNEAPKHSLDTTFEYVMKKVFIISVTSKLLSLITIL